MALTNNGSRFQNRFQNRSPVDRFRGSNPLRGEPRTGTGSECQKNDIARNRETGRDAELEAAVAADAENANVTQCTTVHDKAHCGGCAIRCSSHRLPRIERPNRYETAPKEAQRVMNQESIDRRAAAIVALFESPPDCDGAVQRPAVPSHAAYVAAVRALQARGRCLPTTQAAEAVNAS